MRRAAGADHAHERAHHGRDRRALRVLPVVLRPRARRPRRARAALAPDRRRPTSTTRFPPSFKERLFAYLSRLRSCSYCVVIHSCELRALGCGPASMLRPARAAARRRPVERGAPARQRRAARRAGRCPAPTSEARHRRARGARLHARRRRRAVPRRAAPPARARRLRAARAAARLHRRLPRLGARAPRDLLRRRRPRPAPPRRARARGAAPARALRRPRPHEHARAPRPPRGDRRVRRRRDHRRDARRDDRQLEPRRRAALRLQRRDGPRACPPRCSSRPTAPTRRPRSLRRVRAGERVEQLDTVRVGIDAERLDVSLAVSPILQRTGNARRHLVDRPRRQRAQAARALPADRPPGDARARAVRTVDETLPAVLRVVGEGMGWAVGSVWMPTRRHGALHLRCAAFWHTPALDGASFETHEPPAAARPRRRPARPRLGDGASALGRRRHRRAALAPRRRGAPGRPAQLLPAADPRPGRGHRRHRVPQPRGPPARPALLEMLNRVAGQIGEYLERKGAPPRSQRASRSRARSHRARTAPGETGPGTQITYTHDASAQDPGDHADTSPHLRAGSPSSARAPARPASPAAVPGADAPSSSNRS